MEQPTLALLVCGEGNPAERYSRIQRNSPAVLFRGEYCCLVNSRSGLAGRASVTPADLDPYYLALRSHLEDPAPALAPLLNRIFSVVSPSQIIHVDSVDGIIKLVRSHSDVYALSYYPILKRYEGVDSGELVYIPFEDNYRGEFCLFYSKQACRQHPALKELVKSIQKAATEFLLETGA